MITAFTSLPFQVDDLLAMLEREGGDSPSPEDEIDGGLSIDEVEQVKTLNFGWTWQLHQILTCVCVL